MKLLADMNLVTRVWLVGLVAVLAASLLGIAAFWWSGAPM